MLFNSTVYQIGGGGEFTAVKKDGTGVALTFEIPNGATEMIAIGTRYRNAGATNGDRGFAHYKHNMESNTWFKAEGEKYIHPEFSGNTVTFTNSNNADYAVKVLATFLIPV